MTRKPTQQSMHHDHTVWTADHKSWIDDVEYWQKQHQIATQLLHEINSTMADFKETLDNHARAIELHQTQVDEHEKVISFQKKHGISYTKENDADIHLKEGVVFDQQKHFHELLNHHNRMVQAHVLKLFETMGGTV